MIKKTKFHLAFISIVILYLAILIRLEQKLFWQHFVYPILEIILWAYIINAIRRTNHKFSQFIAIGVFSIFSLIYLIQISSLSLSGSLISSLALENIDQAQTVSNSTKIFMTVVWILLIAIYYKSPKLPPTRKRTFALLSLLVILQVILISKVIGNNDGKLRKRDIPVTNFFFFFYQHSRTKIINNLLCTPQNQQGSREKSIIYQSSPPQIEPNSGKNNVILLFIEGFSSKLLTYSSGGEPLMPNLQQFANQPSPQTLSIQNYYNHTAATYRGLYGQLSSTFPEVDRNKNSELSQNIEILKNIQADSIISLLNKDNYHTVFYSTDDSENQIHSGLKTFGFTDFYTRDEVENNIPVCEEGGHLSAESAFEGLQYVIDVTVNKTKAKHNNAPFFIATYLNSTHAFLDGKMCASAYQGGNNIVLNRFHNMDKAFGNFLAKFKSSKLAKNTILLVTADHATFPEEPYKALFDADTQESLYFVDQIPLLINSPTHMLPKQMDAQYTNSLRLAPTLAAMLNLPQSPNDFLGNSLFDNQISETGLEKISSLGTDFYTYQNGNVIGTKKDNRIDLIYQHYAKHRVCGITNGPTSK